MLTGVANGPCLAASGGKAAGSWKVKMAYKYTQTPHFAKN